MRVFNPTGPRRHFEEPTVEGVGYPILGISEAWNDADEGVLHVTSYAATPSRRGTPTRFRVTRLDDPAAVAMRIDGAEEARWRVVADDAIEVETDVGEHAFRIATRGRRSADDSSSGGRSRGARVTSPGPPRAARARPPTSSATPDAARAADERGSAVKGSS